MKNIVPWLFRSRARLALGLALALLLPMAAASTVIVQQARRSLRTQAERQLELTAYLAGQVVQEHFDGASSYVESFSRRERLVRALIEQDTVTARSLLKELTEGSPPITRAFITDSNGVELADYPHDPMVIGQSFSHRDWFKGVTRIGKLYLSGVYRRAAAPAVNTVALAAPLKDASDHVVGYLVAQDTVETLSHRVAEIRPSPTGGILLLDRYGTIVNTQSAPGIKPLAALQTLFEQRRVTLSLHPVTGEAYFLSLVRLPRSDWHLLAYDSASAVLSPAFRLQWAIVFFTAISFLIVFALSFSAIDAFRRQHVALSQLEASKTQFTEMLVHDLRNPLTALISNVELARDELPDGFRQSHEDLAHAAGASRVLLDMVNDLVDVARMEDGQLSVSKHEHDLGALLHVKVQAYAAAAKTAEVRLRTDVPTDPVLAHIDETLIARVVENLVTNALKHTPPGGEVCVALDDQRNIRGQVVIRVSDTGEGIAAEYIPYLFTKYGRARGQRRSTKYDTGLGLVFCRMAVELHGGSIEVRSRVGEGTEFTVTLDSTQRQARRHGTDRS